MTPRNPLTLEEMQKLHKKQEMDTKARVLVKEVIYYTVFVFFLVCVIYTNQDKNTYLQKEKLQNAFFCGIKEVPWQF